MTATCLKCHGELIEVGPEGGRCRFGHFTARADFAPNGRREPGERGEPIAPEPEPFPGDAFSTISAADLIGKRFPDPKWAIPEILPEGLNLLAGPPKKGKSWLMLGIGAAVAAGRYALGKVEVTAGDVLYLALEDTERRLQERLIRQLDGEAAPAGLHLVTRWPRIGDGGMEWIDHWLKDHPQARLVEIDTLAVFRPIVEAGRSLYAVDYAVGQAIKTIADRYQVTFTLSTHTRKAEAEDPLDAINATQGLAGAADTVLLLRREIGRADASLYVRGRDVPERDHALSFEPVTCQWSLLGDAAEYRLTEGRAEIVKLLRARAPAGMTPKEIADTLGGNRGNVRVLLHRMAHNGEVVSTRGRYTVPLLVPPVTGVTPVDLGTFAVTPPSAGCNSSPPVLGTLLHPVTPVTPRETAGDDKWTRS